MAKTREELYGRLVVARMELGTGKITEEPIERPGEIWELRYRTSDAPDGRDYIAVTPIEADMLTVKAYGVRPWLAIMPGSGDQASVRALGPGEFRGGA